MLPALKKNIYALLDSPKPYLSPLLYDGLMLSLGVGASFFAAYTLGLGVLMSVGLLAGAGILGSAWTYIKHKKMPWTYIPQYYLEKENVEFYDKAEKNTLTTTEAAYYLSKRWYRMGCDFKLGYAKYAIDSVLHFAARHGRGDLVQVFLAYGADSSGKNIIDETPLDVAVKNKQAGVIQLLIDSNAPWDNQLLVIAIKNEDLESLIILCEAIAKQQRPISDKDLPMGVVILKNNKRILEYMIEHFQLDINQYLISPNYMLHCFVSLQNIEGVNYVLSKMDRGNIDIKNDSGRTARDLAHLYRFSEIEKLLEDKGGTLTLRERAFTRLRQQQQQSFRNIKLVFTRFETDLSPHSNGAEEKDQHKALKHRA